MKHSLTFALTQFLLLSVKVRGWESILGSGNGSCLELNEGDTLKIMCFTILLHQIYSTSMDFLIFQVILLVLSCVHVLINK